MTLKSGTGQACAACKYQRRRCTSECLLAPYFPADQPKMFQNVHRLFGIKHIQRLLKDLTPDQHPVAMRSLKYHAAMRDRYPVYGCLFEIQQLNYQIHVAEEELHAILHDLAYYRQHHHSQQDICPPTDDYVSQLQLGMAPPGMPPLLQPDSALQYNNLITAVPVANPQHSSMSNNCNSDYNTNLDTKENNDDEDSLWLQQAYSYSNNNNTTNGNSIITQSELTASHILPIPQVMSQEYNEIHSFFDNIDDRNSFITSKDAYESSLESSLKDSRQTIEQLAEDELKNAAACFSLTSVNE